MEYKLIRSYRKTLGIQVKEGEVIVRAPMFLSKAKIEAFIALKSEWINKAIKKQQAKPPAYDHSDNDVKLLKEKAKAVLQKKAEYYALLMGVSFNKITIRKQKTRWGSCSSKGNLSFNCMLMRLAKAFKPESDFETSFFRCGFVKILVNPKGFTAFCASHTKNNFIYKILRP